MTDARLLGFLACLYFWQWLPSGLIAKALPALLRGHGVSLSAMAHALLAAPRALKFLWAPLIDRFGTRRRWLLALNAVTSMVVVASRDIGAWITTSLVPFKVVLCPC